MWPFTWPAWISSLNSDLRVVRLLTWQMALWGVEPEPFRDLKALGQKPKMSLLLHSIGQHGSQAQIP